MNETLRIGPDTTFISRFAFQYRGHFLKLCDTAERILFQIHIVGGKKHTAQSADDIQLLLFFLLTQLFFQFFPGDIPFQDIHGDPGALAGVDDVILHPPKRRFCQTVPADLLGIIHGAGSFLIQMLRTHDLLELVRIFRMDGGFQSPVKILVVVAGENILHGAVFLDQDSFTLAVFQVDRCHDAVTGFENRCQLHIPKRQGMFLADTSVNVLQG